MISSLVPTTGVICLYNFCTLKCEQIGVERGEGDTHVKEETRVAGEYWVTEAPADVTYVGKLLRVTYVLNNDRRGEGQSLVLTH